MSGPNLSRPHHSAPPPRRSGAHRRPARRLTAVLGGMALVAGAGGAIAPAAGAAPADPASTYIVQLAELPASSYNGTISGYRATRPAEGDRIDAAAPDVVRYRGYLDKRHEEVARRVAKVRKTYDYSLTFNGFAASMTASAAKKLAGTTGVLSVTKDELRKVDTVSTPQFLGLTDRGGLWSKLGGPGKRGAGTGVIVGVVDTGIWPESESFAPLTSPGPLRGWHGVCQTGEQWTEDTCNNKIIGARYYTAGQGGDAAVDAQFPEEFISPRDYDGHGSHTSSTAAGNYHVKMTVDGIDLGYGSGMAPNARIATYKVCWVNGCATSDSMKAIEDATNDGVDVINYSISGSTRSMVDPVEVQFLFAADAGVFVAASAGNSGPGASTVAHNSPWLTTVAAGTHDRVFHATVTLGDGASYTGAGLGAAVPSSPMVLSSTVGKAGADANQVRLCYPGTLDPAKVTGTIVVCDRGAIARVDKSLAVKEAGGVGMVLANTSPSSLNADVHYVPTVHVNETDGAAIKAYVSGTASPTGSLSAGVKETGAQAPFVAAFSSRGPALAGNGDLLKPDIMAPGVDVLAAVSPASSGGRNFDFLSGTSMSSPHLAGIAALIKQAHRRWSPMQIKSALMTTASQRDNTGKPIQTDGGQTAGPLDYGSGQVVPNSAVDPGLTYDSGFTDWVQFLCGAGQLAADGSTCQTYGSIDPSDLNTPNIAIGDLAGVQTVTRTVTNVDRRPAMYRVRVDAPPGVDVKVTPKVLRLAPNRSATYKVTFTRTTAAFGETATGSLTWSDRKHRVTSQLAIRPVPVKAPPALSGTGTSGQAEVSVTAGYNGTLTTDVAGLAAGTARPADLTNPDGAGLDTSNPTASDHTAKFTVTVPAGTTLARFATFDADVPTGTDVDVFVFTAGTNQLRGYSAGPTAEELVDLVNPTAGSYDVYVDLYALAPGVTTQTVTEFDWSLGAGAAGNLTATPASQPVTGGTPVTVTAAWSGLTAGTRYLGRLTYGDGSSALGSTLVTIAG